MPTNTPLAEVFPPGDFVREELEAREWTQTDLAEIMGRPIETINRIVLGKLAITPETARGLAAAFGTSAELWLNLESMYQLSKTGDNTNDEAVSRRARIYSLAPIKEMAKRKWIENSSNLDVLEQNILQFYELPNVYSKPTMAAAARKSTPYSTSSPAETSMVFPRKTSCGEHGCRIIHKNPFGSWL
jgi:HTH-type transcriptional regulator/antitoxin HigA